MFDSQPKQPPARPSQNTGAKAPPKGLFDEGNSMLDESISIPP